MNYIFPFILLISIRAAFCIIEGWSPSNGNLGAMGVVFIDNGIEANRQHRYCTGFLISRWHVTTTAICCKQRTSRTRIRLGSRYAFDYGETHAVHDHRVIAGLSINALDDEFWQICVMKMGRPVNVREKVSIMILARKDDVRKTPKNNREVMGYGSTLENKMEPNNELMAQNLPPQDAHHCEAAYKAVLDQKPRNTSSFLCYGHINIKHKLTHFDSGAPLFDTWGVVWGVAIVSHDLKKKYSDHYPIYAVDMTHVRDQINTAMKQMDGIKD